MELQGLKVGYILQPPYETFVVNEILELRRLGAEVTIFNAFRPFEQLNQAAERLSQGSFYFPPRYKGVVPSNFLKATISPAAYLRASKYCLASRLSKRFLLLSAYYSRIIQQRKITHLHAAFGTAPATVAMLTSWLSGVPYSFTCHAYDVFLPNPTLIDKVNHSYFVVCIADYLKNYLINHYPGVKAEKLRVLHLGVDLAQFQQPSQCRPKERKTILSVARFDPMKGLEYLIQACGLLTKKGVQFDCKIIGTGELEQELKTNIERQKLRDHVHLLGYKTPEEVKQHLTDADLFVLPCIVDSQGNSDGIPVALMEAMAMELPVISTPVSGIPELIAPGCGFLVPQKDAQMLADKIEILLNDVDLCAEMGVRGRQFIKEKFDLTENTKTLGKFFTA